MRCGRIQREGAPAIPRVWLADRWWLRMRGLLGRPPLAGDATEGLLIQPCASVHTVGMGYPLDLVFLARNGQVVGMREGLRPWRAAACARAAATVEFHAGALARLRPRLGETWHWQGTTPQATGAQP